MLPYTEAVLTETLRLANIAPQAAPHATDTDIQLGGSVSIETMPFNAFNYFVT